MVYGGSTSKCIDSTEDMIDSKKSTEVYQAQGKLKYKERFLLGKHLKKIHFSL